MVIERVRHGIGSVAGIGLRTVVAVALLAVGSACGSDSGSDRPAAIPTTPEQTTPGADGASTTAVARSAARWETVSTLSGTGPTRTDPFTILAGAIQWRARYSCDAGVLKVNTDPPPRRPAALVDTACPKEGEGYSIVTGSVSLLVEATGPWRLIVDQQIDTPLDERPLPAMATARVVAEGPFYNVEKNGKGTARLYRLPDGSHALRMEAFEVNQNTDLFVWLSTADSPRTSKDAASAEYWVLGNLKSTLGNQNYTIPGNIPIDRVSSIVIWCQPVSIAYAAAALKR